MGRTWSPIPAGLKFTARAARIPHRSTRPERLWDALTNGEPVNAPPVYGTPYGFLTGVPELVRQAMGTASRPSPTFVYNTSL
jgi:hypothetical protein